MYTYICAEAFFWGGGGGAFIYICPPQRRVCHNATDETPPSVDKVQLLNRALVIIKDLHDIGIQLNDDHLMNGAVELCSHIASHPVNSTSV